MEVLALHLNNYLEYAQAREICNENLLKHAKNLGVDFSNETDLITQGQFYQILDILNTAMNDKLWGIKSGNFISLKLLGLVYRISLQATTIAEGLHYLQSYLNASMPLIKAESQVSKDYAVVTLSISNDEAEINRVILENTLTIISRELQMMAGEEFSFQLETPYYTSSYPNRWLKGAAFKISFEPVILKAAIRQRNQLHLDLLLPDYLKFIEQLKQVNNFSSRVKITMLSMSDPQLPDIKSISDALCLTPRTLQRRLEAENNSFRQVVEDVKKQLCLYLLRHERYTVAGISDLLGYSEPASFIHSFTRWFGDTPQKMRQSLIQQACQVHKK